MKETGAYSAFIALAAIVMLSSTAILAARTAERGEAMHSFLVLEAKKNAQNAVITLDKVMNDAIADAVFAEGCREGNGNVTPPPRIRNRIEEYFATVGQEFINREPGCEISIDRVITPADTGTQGTYTAEITVNCSTATTGKFLAAYSITRQLEKNFTASISGSQCTVEVFDGTTLELSKTG